MLEAVRFMVGRLGWTGTATELIAAARLEGVVSTALSRKLNEHSQRLLEAGIRYSTQRTDRVRTIYLEPAPQGRIDDKTDNNDK